MLKFDISSDTESYKYFTYINTLLYLDKYRSQNEIRKIFVEKDVAYRYQGNFFGLLNELKIDPKFHLFVMYENSLLSPYDYDGRKLEIHVPNFALIENLINIYENS